MQHGRNHMNRHVFLSSGRPIVLLPVIHSQVWGLKYIGFGTTIPKNPIIPKEAQLKMLTIFEQWNSQKYLWTNCLKSGDEASSARDLGAHFGFYP